MCSLNCLNYYSLYRKILYSLAFFLGYREINIGERRNSPTPTRKLFKHKTEAILEIRDKQSNLISLFEKQTLNETTTN